MATIEIKNTKIQSKVTTILTIFMFFISLETEFNPSFNSNYWNE